MFYAFENAGKRNFGFRRPFRLLTRRWMADGVLPSSCGKPGLLRIVATVCSAKIEAFRRWQVVDILMHNEGDFSHVPEISPTTIFSK